MLTSYSGTFVLIVKRLWDMFKGETARDMRPMVHLVISNRPSPPTEKNEWKCLENDDNPFKIISFGSCLVRYLLKIFNRKMVASASTFTLKILWIEVPAVCQLLILQHTFIRWKRSVSPTKNKITVRIRIGTLSSSNDWHQRFDADRFRYWCSLWSYIIFECFKLHEGLQFVTATRATFVKTHIWLARVYLSLHSFLEHPRSGWWLVNFFTP